MAKLPTIPDDLKLLAQPYTDGQKMPDQRFALILQIALLTEENAALKAKCERLCKVTEAARLFCESTVAEMDELEGTDSASAPAEFTLLHEAVKELAAAPEVPRE